MNRKSEISDSVNQFCVQISVRHFKWSFAHKFRWEQVVFRSSSVIRPESLKWWMPGGIIKPGKGLNASYLRETSHLRAARVIWGDSLDRVSRSQHWFWVACLSAQWLSVCRKAVGLCLSLFVNLAGDYKNLSFLWERMLSPFWGCEVEAILFIHYSSARIE